METRGVRWVNKLVFVLLFTCVAVSEAAIITVDTLADDGPGCTLRAAIAEAQSGSGDLGCTPVSEMNPEIDFTINFQESLFDGSLKTITLEDDGESGTGIDVNLARGSILIEGPGSDELRIRAGDVGADRAHEIFDVIDTDESFLLTGLTLSGASDGAIVSESKVILEDVLVTGNPSSGLPVVFIDGAGFIMTDSRIENNSFQSPDVIEDAAALLLRDVIDPETEILRSFIGNNIVSEGSSGLVTGILLEFSFLQLSDSQVANHPDGSGIRGFGSVLHLENSQVTNNQSPVGAGGIWLQLGEIEITRSRIENNTSTFDNELAAGGLLALDADVTMEQSTIAGNRSINQAGGVWIARGDAVIRRTTIANNSAVRGGTLGVHGGGLWLSNASLELVNSTISGNFLESDNTVKLGGGIFHANNGSGDEPDTINILHSSFVNNLGGAGAGALVVRAEADLPTNIQIINSILAQESTEFNLCSFLADGAPIPAFGVANMATDDSCGNNSSSMFLVGEGENGITAFANLKLGELAQNDGSSQTHALGIGSVAIDAANRVECGSPIPFPDQRLVQRPIDGDDDGEADCDIGSYEASEIAYDYGDAPDSYGTTIASGGPRHVNAGVQLGTLRDSEDDGQPTADADGDDNAETDDEDALATAVTVQAGTTLTLEFTVTTNGSSNPVLNAWLDLNQDGDFEDDAGEQVATDMAVIQGINEVTVAIPSAAAAGTYYGRVRVCSDATVCSTPGGTATDGEVEDHLITVTAAEVQEDNNNDNADTGGDGGGDGSSGGGGCSLGIASAEKPDPVLPLLTLLALGILMRRRRIRTAQT